MKPVHLAATLVQDFDDQKFSMSLEHKPAARISFLIAVLVPCESGRWSVSMSLVQKEEGLTSLPF